MYYSKDYYRQVRCNEQIRNSRPSFRRRDRISLLEDNYTISDFIRDGKNADKYANSDKNRFTSRVDDVQRPKYLNIVKDSWERGLDAPIVIHTLIEGSKGMKYYQTLAIVGFWALLVDEAITYGAFESIYGKTSHGTQEVVGLKWARNCDFKALILGTWNKAVERQNGGLNFKAHCTCPDFMGRLLMPGDDDYDAAVASGKEEDPHGIIIGTRGRHPETRKQARGLDFLDARGAVIYEDESPRRRRSSNRAPRYVTDPGCKHLYKICSRTSDITQNTHFIRDVVASIKNKEFLRMAYLYLNKKMSL